MDTSKYLNISDDDLLDRYLKTGNNQWLGALLERYTVLLFGLCMRNLKDPHQAKDVVQQVQLKVIQHVGKYKIDYFHAWIYKIAINECTMQVRKRRRLLTEVTEVTEETEDAARLDPGVHEVFESVEDRQVRRLMDALDELTQAQQTCIRMFYLEDKSYQTISRETGFTMKEIKSHIQNGKRKLKMMLPKRSHP